MKLVKIDWLHHKMSQSHIRVYTYQGEEAYQEYLRNGYLAGNSEHLEKDCEWLDAYDWMKGQMARRIPAYSGDYPVWAWAKRPSAKRKTYKTMADSKYRFTAIVPVERVLPSDYDLWHSPLNGFAVTKTEAEFDSFHGDPKPSWESIFDFSPYKDQEQIRWQGMGNRRQIQLCVDRIYAQEIVQIVNHDSQ
jgi:hypothetical protein